MENSEFLAAKADEIRSAEAVTETVEEVAEEVTAEEVEATPEIEENEPAEDTAERAAEVEAETRDAAAPTTTLPSSMKAVSYTHLTLPTKRIV